MTKGRHKNDGRGRMGGRAAGTPNKVTGAVKAAISDLVGAYLSPAGSGAKKLGYDLETDLKSLMPQERAKLITGLAVYIVPKQQSLSVEDQTRIETESLTAWLETAPDDAIEAIAARVLELQAKNETKTDQE